MDATTTFLSAGAGLLGGLVRGIVGAAKSRQAQQPFSPKTFFLSILSSGAIGCLAATMLFSDRRIALLAGYAGIDLVENLAKIVGRRLMRETEEA